MSDDDKHYYCNQKFTEFSIDIEKQLTYSCCAASPHVIDLPWLVQYPGKLFNTSRLQTERQQMLEGVPVSTCEDNCWNAEKNGLQSRRIQMKSYVRTHVNIDSASPAILNIILGSTCNLTCSYCCKQYSSAWRRDIMNNGTYLDDDRFSLTARDKIIHKISQQEIAKTGAYNLILQEISNFDTLESVVISGGEPFLYNELSNLINELAHVPRIVIHTGLGIDRKRFYNQLSKLQHIKNLHIAISGENCGKFYEFNRYNNSWSNFLINLEILRKKQFPIKFQTVISNLTIFGLLSFYKMFNEKKQYSWCNNPSFLSVHVLDDTSKENLIAQLAEENLPFRDQLISNIQKPSTEKQRTDLAVYLSEFAKRRNLDLGIFPDSMLKWLNLKDNRVV